jgi:hypothetical protein
VNLPFFRRQDDDDRRERLVIPVHSELDKERLSSKVQPLITAAAEKLASSGKVYKWVRYDKSEKLCLWNAEEKMFQFLVLADFIDWIGKYYQVFDSNGQRWLGPSRSRGRPDLCGDFTATVAASELGDTGATER